MPILLIYPARNNRLTVSRLDGQGSGIVLHKTGNKIIHREISETLDDKSGFTRFLDMVKKRVQGCSFTPPIPPATSVDITREIDCCEECYENIVPSPSPTPSPTPQPTPQPSPSPTPQPTPQPSPSPTPQPSPSPTPQPSPSPTPQPSPSPTPQPSPTPAPVPAGSGSMCPSVCYDFYPPPPPFTGYEEYVEMLCSARYADLPYQTPFEGGDCQPGCDDGQPENGTKTHPFTGAEVPCSWKDPDCSNYCQYPIYDPDDYCAHEIFVEFGAYDCDAGGCDVDCYVEKYNYADPDACGFCHAQSGYPSYPCPGQGGEPSCQAIGNPIKACDSYGIGIDDPDYPYWDKESCPGDEEYAGCEYVRTTVDSCCEPIPGLSGQFRKIDFEEDDTCQQTRCNDAYDSSADSLSDLEFCKCTLLGDGSWKECVSTVTVIAHLDLIVDCPNVGYPECHVGYPCEWIQGSIEGQQYTVYDNEGNIVSPGSDACEGDTSIRFCLDWRCRCSPMPESNPDEVCDVKCGCHLNGEYECLDYREQYNCRMNAAWTFVPCFEGSGDGTGVPGCIDANFLNRFELDAGCGVYQGNLARCSNDEPSCSGDPCFNQTWSPQNNELRCCDCLDCCWTKKYEECIAQYGANLSINNLSQDDLLALNPDYDDYGGNPGDDDVWGTVVPDLSGVDGNDLANCAAFATEQCSVAVEDGDFCLGFGGCPRGDHDDEGDDAPPGFRNLDEVPPFPPSSTSFIERYWGKILPPIIPRTATNQQYNEIVRFLNTNPRDETDIPATDTSYRQLGGRHYWNILAGPTGRNWLEAWYEYWLNWAKERCNCGDDIIKCAETGKSCPSDWNDWTRRLTNSRNYLIQWHSNLRASILHTIIHDESDFTLSEFWQYPNNLYKNPPSRWPEVPNLKP